MMGPRSATRNLRSLAGRLFGELDGDEVRQGTFGGPTAVQQARMEAIDRQLDEQVEALNRVIDTSIPALNTSIGSENLQWIQPGQPIGRD